MSALPSIDFDGIKAAADLPGIIGHDLGWAISNGKYRCPFHAESTGSFVVYPDRFKCFGCGISGDVFDWLAHRRGMTVVEAAKYLDPSLEIAQDRPGRTETVSVGNPTVVARSPRSEANRPVVANVPDNRDAGGGCEVWQSADYQNKLDALVRGGSERLWSPVGLPALEWLRRRGLSDDTIRRFRLGFYESTYASLVSVEGLLDKKGQPSHLRAVRGVTIPWPAPGAWHRPGETPREGPRWSGMNVRRLADPVDAPLTVDDADKCRAVRGSKRGYLYPFPDLTPSRAPLPILLCEGEFDTLIGHQVVGHLVHVATAGGASVNPARLPAETRAALARCPRIFLAFDADPAGAKAAWEWLQVYPHKARRALLPHSKDINDFVKAGGDLVRWVGDLIGNSVPDPVRPSLAPVIPQSDAWWSAVRSLGQGPGDSWEPPGLPPASEFFDFLGTDL